MEELQNGLPRAVSAYHEAGHAVAAHVLGLTITVLDIRADERHGGNFRVELPEGSADPKVWRYHPLRELIEKYGVMLAAGYPASLLVAGTDAMQLQHTAQTDRNMLTQDTMDAFPHPYEDPWIMEMERPSEAATLDSKTKAIVEELDVRKRRLADAYYAWLRLRAEALVLYPPHTQAIRTLGAVLMTRETVAGKEAHETIAQALEDYARTEFSSGVKRAAASNHSPF